MKLVLAIALLFLNSILTFAQTENWGQKGDTWSYTLSEEYWPTKERPLPYKVTTVSVSGKTKSINGKVCNNYIVSNGDSCNPLLDSFYCYTDNRVTYYYLTDSNAFYPLYDFNMMPGDSLITQTKVGLLTSYLDSIGSIKIADTTLTVQYLHYAGTGLVDHPDRLFTFYPKNEIFNIEGIGNTLSFFPWWNGFCHNIRTINLRCFESKKIEYHFDPKWNDHCDSTFFWGESSVNDKNLTRLEVFPNPATNTITILNLSPFEGKVKLYQADGKLVLTQLKTEDIDKMNIEVSDVKSGLYYLTFQSKKGFQTSRIVIE